MKSGQITRITAHPKEGTFGSFVLEGQPICNTLEPYGRSNRPYVSCIPTGNYICRRVNSASKGITYEITEVEGRTNILFHSGNRDKDTLGCIVLGEEFGDLWGDWAVKDSKRAFNEFMSILDGDREFRLTIVECY